MSYAPPPDRFVGSSLHTSTMQALTARGIVEPSRDEYLAEASRQGGYVDPLARPVENPNPWEIRRARDNALAEGAVALLRREGKTSYSAQDFHAAMQRVAEQTGHSYREDQREKTQ